MSFSWAFWAFWTKRDSTGGKSSLLYHRSKHQWSDPRTKDESIYIDSQMLDYQIDEGGLVSFEVVEECTRDIF